MTSESIEKTASKQWNDFIELKKDSKPSARIQEAMPMVSGKDEALDLGAGALVSTKYLLEQGFRHVVVVDVADAAKKIARTMPSDRVEFHQRKFENFEFATGKYDLVNAEYALPFMQKDTLQKTFPKIIASLKKDGIFAGTLFGTRHEWNDGKSVDTFLTRDEAMKLFERNVAVLKFDEIEKEGATMSGRMVHWHTYHFIVRKT